MCAIFALLFWGVEWALRGWWEPDEARFVYISREMSATGSWLVPMRNGVPYPDKPPLMMWLIALGEWLFPAHFGSRLPLWIGATLSLRSVWSIGRLWRGRAAGAIAALLLAASFQCSMSFGLGQIDGLLIGFQLAGLRAMLLRRGVVEPGLWFGLAILAKGPVGLAVPLGVWAAIRLAEGCRPGRAAILRAVAVALLSAIPVAAWLAAAATAGDAPGDWLRNIMFSQTVGRAAGGVGGHRHGPLYFIPHLATQFLPWVALVPGAFAFLRRHDRLMFMRTAAWVGFVALFFSIPVCKRNIYILMTVPGMALALASAWPEALPRRLREHSPLVLAAVAVIFALANACKPLLNPLKTPTPMAGLAASYIPDAGGRLLLFDMRGETLALHANRRGLRCDDDEALRSAMRREGRGLAIFGRKAATNLVERFPELSGQPSGSFGFGSKAFVWAAFREIQQGR